MMFESIYLFLKKIFVLQEVRIAISFILLLFIYGLSVKKYNQTNSFKLKKIIKNNLIHKYNKYF